MNTTELFAEQVLIGFLVILVVGLVFLDQLSSVGNPSTLAQIVIGGFLVGTAYLIGMVYDRIADTLLQDLESQSRISFALRAFAHQAKGEFTFIEPKTDIFEDGKSRILVLGNAQATHYMDYLRSRIRLTRALATLIPGLMLALLLALVDRNEAGPWWTVAAVTIPVVYAVTLLLKVMYRKPKGTYALLFERPPKTYRFVEVGKYMKRARLVGTNSPDLPLWFLFQDEVWIALLLLTAAATTLILVSGSYALFPVVVVGVVLTIIVGWCWLRISGTFFAFLRDYAEYGLEKSSQ